jgi:hypothetical protein
MQRRASEAQIAGRGLRGREIPSQTGWLSARLSARAGGSNASPRRRSQGNAERTRDCDRSWLSMTRRRQMWRRAGRVVAASAASSIQPTHPVTPATLDRASHAQPLVRSSRGLAARRTSDLLRWATNARSGQARAAWHGISRSIRAVFDRARGGHTHRHVAWTRAHHHHRCCPWSEHRLRRNLHHRGVAAGRGHRGRRDRRRFLGAWLGAKQRSWSWRSGTAAALRSFQHRPGADGS